MMKAPSRNSNARSSTPPSPPSPLSPASSASLFPSKHDYLFNDQQQQQQQQHTKKEEEALENAMYEIGNLLQHTDEMLNDLEQNGMLGPAIKRYASDLATVVGNVARDLDCSNTRIATGEAADALLEGAREEREREQRRREWAKALIEDAKSQLELDQEEDKCQPIDHNHNNNNNNNNNHSDETATAKMTHQKSTKSAANTIATMDEIEIMNAMQSAQVILLDIEHVLRDISDDDAEEIADVALVVAKMFLWGLQNVQTQAVLHTRTRTMQNGKGIMNDGGQGEGMTIEILDDDDDGNTQSSNQTIHDNDSNNNRHQQQQQQDRLKLLWPPIGQSIISIASWSKEESIKHPILSIALALSLWPSLFIIAFISPPLLLMDYTLQYTYDNILQNTPLIQKLEHGAANMYQIGKLNFLISKLMVKQSVRVTKRQIRRRGGIDKIIQDVRFWTLDRITHPVESVGMAFDMMKVGVDVALGAASFVRHTVATSSSEASSMIDAAGGKIGSRSNSGDGIMV